ncbi:MAG: DUF547 domain-containing protein [Magnetococcales bacterium]|nr:DUF547 domain-containing protein [Magnetococcales bacterium]
MRLNHFLRPRPHLILLLTALLLSLLLPTPAPTQEPNWNLYAGLLKRHLTHTTHQGIQLSWLNYPALNMDRDFPRVVNMMADFPAAKLKGHKEKLAFHINAYNVLAIKMVLDHWPTKSIKKVGGLFTPVWKKRVGRLSGKIVTLHEVEHEILRPMGEPRIHMAIVCASLSCPDLRSEPYSAAKLEQQLEDQTRHFLHNRSKGLRLKGQQVRLSKIFDWFEKDFGNLNAFLRHYRPDLPQGFRIRGHLPYHWALNGPAK